MDRTLLAVGPLHAGWAGEGSVLLLGVIFLASLGTGLLFVVSLFAYRQRRSRRYLFISVAVGALFTRSIVGAGTVLGFTPMVIHHLIEHTFDFLIAALVLYVVLRSGPTSDGHYSAPTSSESQQRRYEDSPVDE
jgi:hypothetical protein